MRGFNEDNIPFIRTVLTDAKMVWPAGEYKKRVTSFNSIFLGTYSERWKETNADDMQDPLFKQKELE